MGNKPKPGVPDASVWVNIDNNAYHPPGAGATTVVCYSKYVCCGNEGQVELQPSPLLLQGIQKCPAHTTALLAGTGQHFQSWPVRAMTPAHLSQQAVNMTVWPHHGSYVKSAAYPDNCSAWK